MPVGGNTVICTSSGSFSAVPPICGADSGCSGESALRHTSGAISTTCSADMVDQETCAAVCNDGESVEGTIKCVSGRLVDSSHCISDAGLQRKDVFKVFGTVDSALTGSPTSASMTKAFAEAFNVNQEYVVVDSDAFPTGEGRILSERVNQRALLRFLQAANTVKLSYTVVVPLNMSQQALRDAMSLSEANSAAGRAFVDSLASAGIKVQSVSYHYDPVVVKSMILTDQSGEVVKFDVTQKPTSAPPISTDWSITTIIAIIVGGLICFSCSGFMAQYLLLMRRKAEA